MKSILSPYEETSLSSNTDAIQELIVMSCCLILLKKMEPDDDDKLKGADWKCGICICENMDISINMNLKN